MWLPPLNTELDQHFYPRVNHLYNGRTWYHCYSLLLVIQIFLVTISYRSWKNIIPVKVLSCCFQIMVKSFNNTWHQPFLFQSQPCSHFLIQSYSFFINVNIRLSNKVWFIPAHCDVKICKPSMLKFSFKSFKNIECG